MDTLSTQGCTQQGRGRVTPLAKYPMDSVNSLTEGPPVCTSMAVLGTSLDGQVSMDSEKSYTIVFCGIHGKLR